MNNVLGAGNNLFHYVLVLCFYGLMYLFIRYPKPGLELNYKANYKFLFGFWSVLMFTGNYVFFKLGVMSFLPWLNNFIHSFIWVGLCLGWLYYCTHERPLIEQIIVFAFASFIIKMAEHTILGTWNQATYLGINNRYVYIIAMSVVDGLYPVLSMWMLNALGRKSTFGIYTQ